MKNIFPGKIVKNAEAVYGDIKKYNVRIIESDVKYGSGDYEDPPEIKNDKICKCYYYELESLIEKNCYNAGGFAGETIEEAIVTVEKILNQKCFWQ